VIVTGDLIAVAACLVGSGFFSASETALTSLPITRLEAMRTRSGRLTRAGLDRWATAPQELLITILVGNNLVNVLASALATTIAYRFSTSGSIAFVVGLMTLVILIFGEITPKTLAQRHAEWIAAHVAPVLYVLDIVLTPVNRVLGLLSRLLSRGEPIALPVTEEDLLFMARLAHRHAQLARDARFMIERVVSFQQAVVREVMVPRPRVVTVDVSWSLEVLERFIAESVHSRFPVVDGSPDEIVGVLHAKHLFRLADGRPWTGLVVPPLYVPETRAVRDLLQDFRRTGQHLAIVLDEFGGLSGVITLEDALELLVGEIEDEFDSEQTAAVVPVEGGWSVPGYLSLRRLEVLLHHPIPRPPDIDSVGGLVVHLLPDPAAPGARAESHGLRFEVEEIEGGRPSRVLVRAVPPGAGSR
jgi:putative hemolysin